VCEGLYDYCDRQVFNHAEEASMRKKRDHVVARLTSFVGSVIDFQVE
jgi:hypothetical protein